ncbi:hypothetical protein [Granulicella tundricola]|uniref:hypothetical protein n=1 Tax=Granulicella tundricola TaxID=940615 RepID=UPI0005A290F9|nr:hypothetical protein [Granulicella tundricola]
MEALWIVIALLAGGLAVYVLIKPRLSFSASEAASEKVRAAQLDAARQQLEIEIAGLRSVAGRVTELIARAEEDRSTILELTEKHSAATSSLADRDDAIGDLRSQVISLTEEAEKVRKSVTDLEIEKATMASAIAEREASLKEERKQFTETAAAFKAQFAELSADALKDNGEKFLETASACWLFNIKVRPGI